MKRWLIGIGVTMAVAAVCWAFVSCLKYERESGAVAARQEQAAVNAVAQGRVDHAVAKAAEHHAAFVQATDQQTEEDVHEIEDASDLGDVLADHHASIVGLRAQAAAEQSAH